MEEGGACVKLRTVKRRTTEMTNVRIRTRKRCLLSIFCPSLSKYISDCVLVSLQDGVTYGYLLILY